MSTQHLSLRNLIVVAMFVALAASFLFSGSVHAQENDQEEATENQTSTMQFVPETYNYTVAECNNMTVLVRKSLQLYDQANDDVSLNEAQTLYAETNIINDINASDLIYIGDSIAIASEKVAEYAQRSQDLSAAQVAAWNTYAANVDFELADVEARNVASAVNEDGSVTVNERNEDTGETVEISDTSSDSSDQSGDQADSGDEDDGSSAVPWVVAAASIIALWYLLWQRGGEEE